MNEADLCRKCGVRPATIDWVGDGGALAFVHGMSQRWCDRCVLVEQIAYAEKAAANLLALREALAEIDVAYPAVIDESSTLARVDPGEVATALGAVPVLNPPSLANHRVPNTSDDSLLLSVTDAARLVGCGEQAIRNAADRGRLPCLRTRGNGQRLFARTSVEQFARGRGTMIR